jgi:hypothetical protein
MAFSKLLQEPVPIYLFIGGNGIGPGPILLIGGNGIGPGPILLIGGNGMGPGPILLIGGNGIGPGPIATSEAVVFELDEVLANVVLSDALANATNTANRKVRM